MTEKEKQHMLRFLKETYRFEVFKNKCDKFQKSLSRNIFDFDLYSVLRWSEDYMSENIVKEYDRYREKLNV